MKKFVQVLVLALSALVFSRTAHAAAPFGFFQFMFAPTPATPVVDSFYLSRTSTPSPPLDTSGSLCQGDSLYVRFKTSHSNYVYLYTPSTGVLFLSGSFYRVYLSHPIDTLWAVPLFESASGVITHGDTVFLIVHTTSCGSTISYFTSASSACVGSTMTVSWGATDVRTYLNGGDVADTGTRTFTVMPGINTETVTAVGTADSVTRIDTFYGTYCDTAILDTFFAQGSGCIGDTGTFVAHATGADTIKVVAPDGTVYYPTTDTFHAIIETGTYVGTAISAHNSNSRTTFVTGIHCNSVSITAASATVLDTCIGSGLVRITDSVINASSVTLTGPSGTFAYGGDTTLPIVVALFDYTVKAIDIYGDTVTWSLPVHGDACMVPTGLFTSSVSGTCIGTSVILDIQTQHATSRTVTTSVGTYTVTSDSALLVVSVTDTANVYVLHLINAYGSAAYTVTVHGEHCDTVNHVAASGPASACINDSVTITITITGDTAIEFVSSGGTQFLPPGTTTVRTLITGTVNTYTVTGLSSWNAMSSTCTVFGSHCDSVIGSGFGSSASPVCITDSVDLNFSFVNDTGIKVSYGTVVTFLPPGATTFRVPVAAVVNPYSVTGTGPYNSFTDVIYVTGAHCYDTVLFPGLGGHITGTECAGYDSIELDINVLNADSVRVYSSTGAVTYTTTAVSALVLMYPLFAGTDTFTIVAMGPYNSFTRGISYTGAPCPPAAINSFSVVVTNGCIDSLGSVNISFSVGYDTSVLLVTPLNDTLTFTGSHDTAFAWPITHLSNAFTLIDIGLHTTAIETLTVTGTYCHFPAIDTMYGSVLHGCIGHDSVTVHFVTHNAAWTSVTDPSGTHYPSCDSIRLLITRANDTIWAHVGNPDDTVSSYIVIHGDSCTVYFTGVTVPDTVCLDTVFTGHETTNAPATVAIHVTGTNSVTVNSDGADTFSFKTLGLDTLCYVATGPYNSDTVYKIVYVENCDESVPIIAAAQKFLIYPVPFSAEFVVSSTEEIGDVTVTDMVGKEVFKTSSHEKEIHIPASHWPPGMYLVHFNTEIAKVVKE